MAISTKYELKLGAATREAFGRTLAELGNKNKNVVVCDADLSKSTYTVFFQKEHPDRFIECGIAEANMVAIGSGLAAAGKIPFVSSFSAFVINKGFEQLRVTAAYPNVNLKVVGTHSGISIGEDGPSQMSIEDLSLACNLPGFTVLAPADEVSMAACIHLAAETFGPFFVRAGRAKAAIVYEPGTKFHVGGSHQLIDGKDIAIFANGLLVAEAIKAAEQLDAIGISARVIDLYSIKPIDREAITKAAEECGAIVVAEEHLKDTGIGTRVAQVVVETAPCVMEFVGLTNYAESGTPEAVLEKYGMTASVIVTAAKKALARKKK
ncbi:transketolase family protein [Bryobacter aggregatus]|uniref:transketolase family protein n=1 Tax=Bryobacter aggregatus TaxID=360054 RepID=UPI0004E1403D|nr:transketolase C-terminal domain-containing protein [Bryobacter aggregatus]